MLISTQPKFSYVHFWVFFCSDYPIECKPGLDWSTRLSVLKEIAEMLLCFHYAGQPTIMFWNIIAQNIFLDNFWSPKILNLFYMDLRECQFHKRVYFPPDYPIYDHTSKSLDVFKFGILILWAISGMKSANLQRPPEQQFWSEWVCINNLVASYICKIPLDP